MHYYQFNIGDYASHTRHLSMMEDLIYRRLLDWYYLNEKPIPKDCIQASRLIQAKDHFSDVEQVLNEFFTLTDDGWINKRADVEISHFKAKSEQASKAGKASAQARFNGRSTDVQPNNNHKPLTINQDTKDIVHSKAVDACPHEKIIELYHSTLPTMSSVKVWTAKRSKLLQARWREDTKRQDLDYWERFFGYVSQSDFLCGRTEKPFNCDLEWMLNASNFVKIIEGKYHAG